MKEFKVGDKIIINFDEILKIKKDNAEEYEMVKKAIKLNKNKIFTIKRKPSNNSVQLTEDILPYSDYVVTDYIMKAIKIERKEKIKKINKKINIKRT